MKARPYRFHATVKVRYNETDMQGHVNFGHFLFYFDIGLTEYLDAIGYDYEEILAEGTDFVYVEAHCNYHSPARWPEELQVFTRIGRIGRRSIRFEFDTRAATDGRQVATGHIVAVTVKPGSTDPAPIPDRLRGAVADFESGPPDSPEA